MKEVSGTIIADGVIVDEVGRVHLHSPQIDQDIAAIAEDTGASEEAVREMYRAAVLDLSRHAERDWSDHPTQQFNSIQEQVRESTLKRLDHVEEGDDE